jgi:hypothetical protein
MGKAVTLSKQRPDNPPKKKTKRRKKERKKEGICEYYSKFESWSEDVSNELFSLPMYSQSRWYC